METKTITVEERHLDMAIAAPRSLSVCESCVMYQATAEQLNAESYGMIRAWIFGNKQRWEVIPEDREIVSSLIGAYDDGRFDDARAMLPLSVTFKLLGEA